jgi:sugar lactone lactonase YvrE
MRITVALLASVSLLGACLDADEPGLSADDGFDDTVDTGKADGASASVHVVHAFGDHKLYPEGGAFDPQDRAFFVGSLGHGNLTRVDAHGAETIVYPGTGEANRLTLGMQVDAARRQLWVCTTKDSLGSVWRFDLTTGARTADLDLRRVNPRASCNDVLVMDDGGVLVSDRENPYIYRVSPALDLSVWAHDPALKGAVISLNSMAFTPDHHAVLTATYLPPALVRVSVDDPRDVRTVKLGGDLFMDGFNLLNGPDDLVMQDGQLIVAFGSSLKRITPSDASWSRATVRSTRTIGGVTALVQDAGKVYGINGQSVRFALGVTPAPFEIFEVDLARLR